MKEDRVKTDNVILGLGAGGHARVILDAVRLAGKYQVAGLIDQSDFTLGRFIDEAEILGGEDRLEELRARGIRYVFNGVGGLADSDRHATVYERVTALGFEFVTVIHSHAVVARTARIGPGSVILAGAVVNAGAVIGANAIINTGAIVEHDCNVGDHTHIAPGAVLLGNVEVRRRCLIGARAVVRQGLIIEDSAIVGAGAAVVSNVAEGMCVVGVPAAPLYAYAVI